MQNGRELGDAWLLDTTVYIDGLQDRLPAPLLDLPKRPDVHHSSVALAELTHVFGRLDPDHPETAPTQRALSGVIDDLPPSRLTAPTVRTWGEAGMLAGLTARLSGRPHDQALLNDALLLLQAAESGQVLLTRNVGDFDVLGQLAPEARVVFYRRG